MLALTAEMYSLKRNIQKHTEIGHKIQDKFKIHQEKNNVQKVNFAYLTFIKQIIPCD